MNIRFIYSRHARQAALAVALFALYAGIAQAQAGPANAPSTPLSPPAAMTREAPSIYRSAFEGYKPYTDEKTIDWKQANDNTGKIGGWREYAKEAQQSDAADAGPKPAPDVKPAKP